MLHLQWPEHLHRGCQEVWGAERTGADGYEVLHMTGIAASRGIIEFHLDAFIAGPRLACPADHATEETAKNIREYFTHGFKSTFEVFI